jgi:hypothetical protein
VQVPDTALLTDGESTFVYVRTGPESCERRDVTLASDDRGRVTIRDGIQVGDEVVVEGGYKIKAEAVSLASSD